MSGGGHRAGVVAILGLPNAGKSTLLNRLVGQKLAIVTRKAQTTRSRVLGITRPPGGQILWVDTPGFLEGERPLDRAMRGAVEKTLVDCDVALLLVDLIRGVEARHNACLERLAAMGKVAFLVGNKLDRRGARERPWPPAGIGPCVATPRIAARRGVGVPELEATVFQHLPEGPPYYPDGQITDRPLRFLAAEAVREAAFALLERELPYHLAVQVREFDESDPRCVRIRAHLLVVRNSQKRIVVGTGGDVIKRIGVRARLAIEKLMGVPVHLALRVVVDPDWVRQPRRLEALGYR